MENYSVLMSVYNKDNSEWLKLSLDSIINQEIRPTEIVIIKDGKLNEKLNGVLDTISESGLVKFKFYQFDENVGLGRALQKGITICTNEYIARMDADDYARADRCKKQLEIFAAQPDLDLVGSNVLEFTGNIENIVSKVNLPERHIDIIKFAKKRCPIRHPALMYRKSTVLRAGNYDDFKHAQDYELIVRMLLCGAKMYNIQDYLTYMRVSDEFYKRRGGWQQMKLIIRLKTNFYQSGFYTLSDYIISTLGNCIICMMPNSIRTFIYKNFLRKG